MSTAEIPRRELEVESSSLHYRIYQWRYEHTTDDPPRIENLCRYMRTILIWAPLVWFFIAPLKRWVRPWMIAASILTALGIGYSFYTWPEESWRIFIRLIIALSLGGLAALALYLGDRYSKVLKWTTVPLWGGLYLSYKFSRWSWSRWLKSLSHWFIFARSAGRPWMRPWVVTVAFLLASLFVTASVIWGFSDSVSVVLLIAAIVVLVVLVVVLFALGIKIGKNQIYEPLVEREVERIVAAPAPTARKKVEKKGPGLARMVWNFILAKKAKVCPFIILPEASQKSVAASGSTGSD